MYNGKIATLVGFNLANMKGFASIEIQQKLSFNSKSVFKFFDGAHVGGKFISEF